jgi:hypothetical protein
VRAALLAVAFLLLACGGKSAPAAKENNYFPMAAGYEWKYTDTQISYLDSVRAETTTDVSDAEFRCIGRQAMPNGREAWTLYHHARYNDKSERARAAKDTVMWYTDTIFAERSESLVLVWRNRNFDHPNLELVLPLHQGRTRDVRAGKVYAMRATAVRQETVKVPAGEYAQAWRIEDSTTYAEGKTPPTRIVRWYAAGVGLVKTEMESRRTDGTLWRLVEELVSAKTGR